MLIKVYWKILLLLHQFYLKIHLKNNNCAFKDEEKSRSSKDFNASVPFSQVCPNMGGINFFKCSLSSLYYFNNMGFSEIKLMEIFYLKLILK